jgi:hypothetical protein
MTGVAGFILMSDDTSESLFDTAQDNWRVHA